MKHQVVPMDLVAVDTVDGRVFSFLSVTWGLLADIDIESERFRSLGGARFTVEAVARLISEYMTFQIKYSMNSIQTCNSVTFYLTLFHEKTHFLILAGNVFCQKVIKAVNQSQFTPKMKANAVSRLLSSLV